jgi:hypothetical protein
MNTEDALEVAKLAAAVGGQLKNIDQFTTERTSNPANKININNFIAKVRNPNASFGPARYLTDLPSGFAAPPPEEYIQQMVPEQPSLIPQQIPLPQLQQATMATAPELMPIQATLPTAVAPVENQKTSPKKQNDFNLTRGDVDSIKNSLKNIDKTLSGMLTLLQDKKKINND